ncbi:hypothetical protein PRIPAC_83655 [Pristionchus pacificus]|uniref:Uncharacterized protein n=1 Tax=Pristionchus pacificus TaxID=54126 RepID=A0A2A6BKD3_PRIPA|nr:hypothetical protein PRIPAC_83655 [Pristionchus pacificus]|eukprot:PDM66347.1 hypothetical protein PRIPAC_47764 [Pristionchus pacificus]
MHNILFQLFCAAAAQIPLIDEAAGKSGFFNYQMQKFEERRLYANIVDTVSYDSSDDKDVLPTAVSIGLKPSENEPDFYAFVSRNIAKRLDCVDASDAEFEQDASEPDYVLIVQRNHTYIGKNWQTDPAVVLGQVATEAGMSEDEASRMALTDCWYLRGYTGEMQINVAVAPEERTIRSGWIVERYPIGTLRNTSEPHYVYPVFLTNYTYIDRDTGKFVDVQESRADDGSRVWTPTGWPVFARVGEETAQIGEDGTYTRFRETETGVLITTLSQEMRVTYNIDEESTEEVIQLHDSHHYFVSCNIKEGTATRALLVMEDSRLRNISTNDGVEIELQSGDRIDRRYMCAPKRTTASGAPELLQLDFIEQSGSRSIPWSDREITVRRIAVVREETTTTVAMLPDGIEEFNENEMSQDNNTIDEESLKQLDEFKEQRKEEEDLLIVGTVILRPQPEQEQGFELERAEVEDDDEKFLTLLALLVLAVSLLALGCVICTAACIRSRVRSRDPLHRAWAEERREEQARKRKEGSVVLRQQSLKKLDSINEKNEEDESLKLSTSTTPTRSNSANRITFAPKPAGMRTDDLVKMIAEEEIGSRIDAMVEAGPDGEEEQPKDVQPVQLEDPAAAAAASPIGDDAAGTPVAAAPVAARRAGVEAEEEEQAPRSPSPRWSTRRRRLSEVHASVSSIGS